MLATYSLHRLRIPTTMKWIIGIAAILTVAVAVDWNVTTPLDEYVHFDDGYYSWEILGSHRYNDCTVHVVNMTSQKWQDETYVDRPYWYHIMGIAVPDELNLTHSDAGFLFINAGSNDPDDSPPGADDLMNVAMCLAALDLGTVGGYINQVPNQPLYFQNDPGYQRRSEDSLIAWTWRTFMDAEPPDPTVVARMPMTKAAKRGLDTISAVANQEHSDYVTEVNRFLVLGASKRGWTTWSLAATDQRVIAAAPLVFSMLKFNETLQSHFRALGGAWSFAFEPYYRENLTQELFTPKAEQLFLHEDMYGYRERFTIPLLQMVSTGDEFFLLQDSHHWWNDIPDPKWTYMLENAEHAMFPHYFKLYETATAWYTSILEGLPIPQVTWQRGETPDGGFIDFSTDTSPENITVYRAVTLRNDTRRDFRLAVGDPDVAIEFHPVLWTEWNSNLEITGPNQWRATTEKVDDEWVGFLVQAMWRGPEGERVFFTSETQIIPDTFPVDRCTDAASCFGTLI